MRTTDFDYFLPQELIAQHPVTPRTNSRLMHVQRASQTFLSRHFSDLPNLLQSGDLLVLNNSQVLPSRLFGRKAPSGGEVEILLLHPDPAGGWSVLLRPGKRVRAGTRLLFGATAGPHLDATIAEKHADGRCRLEFAPGNDVLAFADAHGVMPLPPYIRRDTPLAEDRERYQTVYAREPGSAAAPTAGLHFSPELLQRLGDAGIRTAEVTLHVGIGTFAPVKTENPLDHVMHTERFQVPASTVEAVQRTREAGRRVVAVGTTSLRVLESVARAHDGRLVAGSGTTNLFLHPPARFFLTDALLTNFHLPRSTLLMLVSAFAAPGATTGRDLVLRAYQAAVAERFRFFSYGDAMWIE